MMRALSAMVAVLALLGACDRDNSKQQPPAADAGPSVSAQSVEEALSAAQEYMNGQDPAKAIAILVTLIDRAPNEVRGYELYGQALTLSATQAERRRDQATAAEHRAKAYEQYQRAVQLKPDSAGLQHSAGLMAMAAGQESDAIERFREAGRLDSSSAQYPLFEAQLLIKQHRLDEARAALGKALAIDPDEPIAHASLAMVALEELSFDEALKHMATARRLKPSDVALRAQEARIHRVKGDPARAIELLVGLSDRDRGSELVAFEIASSYSARGDHLNAARAWQHCYQSNPVASRAWLAAVRTGEELLKAGERDQATMWLQQAQIAAPDRPEVAAFEAAIRQSP